MAVTAQKPVASGSIASKSLFADRVVDDLTSLDSRIAVVESWRLVAAMTPRTVNSAGFTSTEILLDSLTFTAVAGAVYKATWESLWRSSAVIDNGEARMRWAPGASVTNTSTLLKGKLIQPPAVNANVPVTLTVPNITTFSAGTVTVGVFGMRTGTGTHTSEAGTGWRTDLWIERMS